MTVKCSADRFRGIVNPYTGEPVEVKMLVRERGTPLFFAPDTYSTADFFPTAAQALDMWDRVDGVGGMKPRTSLKCAYTGEDLRVEEVPGVGFHLVGGFNPKALASDEEFLYLATMRDGKAARPKPAPCRVEAPPEEFTHTPGEGDEELEPTDEARKVAEAVVMQHKDALGLKKRTSVSASGKGRR